MSKIMHNLISLGTKLSLILALGMVISPVSVAAEGGRNYTFGNFDTTYGGSSPELRVTPDNPKPVVRSLNPKSGTRGTGHTTITVTGVGFAPSSVAKVNGMNRPTTYIDYSHLLVQVDLNEPYRTEDGFYVSVWNPAPGGGHSNGAFFKLAGEEPAPMGYVQNGNYGYGYGPNGEVYYDNNVRTESLASSVILGDISFLPTSLVQWVFVAILILAIVILSRRIFGHREEFDNAPLKHA